jgi:prevent-host-death family protein
MRPQGEGDMIIVGVRELKNRLSYYLRHVRQGNPVTITDRGESVAVLVPSQQSSGAQIAETLSRKGIGSWKGGKPRGASRPVAIKGRPVSRIVIEERR